VLARLMAGDPLRLRERVAEGLQRNALLLDPDRVVLRCAARIARFAQRYRGQPDIEAWLRSQVDGAAFDLVAEDEEQPRGAGDAAFQGLGELARPLGFDPQLVHEACVVHNRFPLEERRVFRSVVLEGRSLDELAARSGQSATDLARCARRVFDGMGAVFSRRAP